MRSIVLLLACLVWLAPIQPVRAEGVVHPDPESVAPLPVGSRVPSVQVETVDGRVVDLAALVREQGALLVFYRGGW